MSTSIALSKRNIPVARPSIGVEEEAAVLAVLRSGWISQGPKVAEFEREFAAYVGAPHAVAVSSCTTALHLAMVAAGVKEGEEVLCPSLSFIATANAIRYVGATPVFVDIDPLSYNIDPRRIEEAITPRTRAILAVHQIGMPAAMDELADIARRHNLVLLEDAACASGSRYKGERIGHPHSLMACFSFHPRKVLSTGEGGMISTADDQIAARLRRLRQHAMSVSDLARHASSTIVTETYDEVGFNFRMTDMQAALGLVQLKRLPGFLERRRARAAKYTAALSHVPFLVPPTEPRGCETNYQSYMVRILEHAPISRDELMQNLLDRGISTRRGIMPIHRERPYGNECWDTLLPETNRAADNTIILPLFDQMSDDDQEYVIDAIVELCRG
jgi:dTDP-4-amino-4,6-dideoxygalactose transaminase